MPPRAVAPSPEAVGGPASRTRRRPADRRDRGRRDPPAGLGGRARDGRRRNEIVPADEAGNRGSPGRPLLGHIGGWPGEPAARERFGKGARVAPAATAGEPRPQPVDHPEGGRRGRRRIAHPCRAADDQRPRPPERAPGTLPDPMRLGAIGGATGDVELGGEIADRASRDELRDDDIAPAPASLHRAALADTASSRQAGDVADQESART